MISTFDDFASDPLASSTSTSTSTSTTPVQPFSIQYTPRFLQYFIRQSISKVGFGGLPSFGSATTTTRTTAPTTSKPHSPNVDEKLTSQPHSHVSSLSSSSSSAVVPQHEHSEQKLADEMNIHQHDGFPIHSKSHKDVTPSTTKDSMHATRRENERKELEAASKLHKDVSPSTNSTTQKSILAIRLENERKELEAETTKIKNVSDQISNLERHQLKFASLQCEHESRLVTKCYRMHSHATLQCAEEVNNFWQCANAL